MRLFIAGIMLAIMTGCGTTYVTVRDNPYTQMTEIQYDSHHRVVEGDMENYRTCYTKYIKKGMRSPVVIDFDMAISELSSNSYTGADLDEIAYVLIDGTSHQVKLIERKNNKTTSYFGSETIMGTSSRYGHGTTVTGSGTLRVSSIVNHRLHARVLMTHEMEQALAVAKSMSIRISAGKTLAVLKISASQLEMLRELVNLRNEVPRGRQVESDEKKMPLPAKLTL